MLRPVADGVLIHQSEFCQSNAVVVQGRAGVLLIDPGVLGDELGTLADDLDQLGQPVVAGFSTHPHWDHLLWDARFGAAPRYGTARCAARIGEVLAAPGWEDRVAGLMPPHRPARRDGAGSLGRPRSPDHRASGARPGPRIAADRRPPGPRGRRHAL